MIFISVIIPCCNELGNIEKLYEQLSTVLKKYDNYEIIFIDDGSTDGTIEKIKNLTSQTTNLKYISFSRNFGHQPALKAGLDYASGDCVISMDADMQHPPEIIPQLIECWQQGYEVVNTIRSNDEKLPFIKKVTSKTFYWLINKLSSSPVIPGAADFRLLDRKVVLALREIKEYHLFFRGLIPWLGFKQTAIYFEPNERFSGVTKYSFTKMVKFAINGITSFSIKPLRFSIYVGFVIALLAFFYGLYAIYVSTFTDTTIPGWTSVIVSVLFLTGIQLLMFGILGEYLGKLFIENKGRPIYIIKEKGNI